MTLIQFYISIAFYIQLLLSSSLAYTFGEFPSIRPIPCQNRMTGESGICTFNWSCKNVAHGIHIGSCLDRFFVGACCKIPKGEFGGESTNSTTSPSTTQGYNETTKEHSETTEDFVQMESSGKVTDSTIPKERLNPLIPTNANSNHAANSDIHEIFSDATKDAETSAFSLNKKPVLPYIFKTSSTLTSNYLSHKQTSNEQEISVPVTPPVKLIPSSAENYSSFTHVPQGSSSTFVSSEDQATAQSFANESRTQHELYSQRNPITSVESYILNLFSSHNLQNQNGSVPDRKGDHEISIVLEESVNDPSALNHQTHTEKIPNNTFLSWAYNFLNDEKNNISTNETNLPSAGISPLLKPSHLHNPGSQHEVMTYAILANSTGNEIDNSTLATSDILRPTETIVNIHKIHLNFTKFTEPQYPWPSSKPPSSYHSTSTPEAVTFGDISRVCGRSRSNIMARIVGGRKSHSLRWPWMISLRRYEGRSFKHKCGAALLNQFWAITAAHCVHGKLPNDVILRLGEHNFHRMDESHPHVERRIYMIVIHPGFDPATYENDLALLRFYEPVRFQANIVPVCLPKFSEDIAGRTAVVTGWGRLSEEGELPGSLHEVQMPILTNEECENMYSQAGYSETIRDVFVCAGLRNGGLDACEGDSGGPMVLRGERGQWMLVGLISWGMGCAAPRQPGVYTRITKFVDWIDANILY